MFFWKLYYIIVFYTLFFKSQKSIVALKLTTFRKVNLSSSFDKERKETELFPIRYVIKV